MTWKNTFNNVNIIYYHKFDIPEGPCFEGNKSFTKYVFIFLGGKVRFFNHTSYNIGQSKKNYKQIYKVNTGM